MKRKTKISTDVDEDQLNLIEEASEIEGRKRANLLRLALVKYSKEIIKNANSKK